ncbi:MAG: hypothetical protein GF405_04665 [Candidatus Eisenbacteria bacterium]|nr:hypothetical protein [Candidatus Eisenbacteria bacterium]
MCGRTTECGHGEAMPCLKQFDHLRECWGSESDPEMLKRYRAILKEMIAAVEARINELG